MVCAVLLRIWAARRGSTWDFESFQIAAGLYLQGGVVAVYSGTTRYNYGPLWAIVIGEIARFTGTGLAFRYAVVCILTVADLVTSALLSHCVGLAAGAAFILAPTSVIITGYHSQIEPLALALAVAGVILYGERCDGRVEKRKIGGLVLLGVPLTAKHFAFAFSFWLALKERRIMRMVALIVPIGVFALWFVPFLPGAGAAIRADILGTGDDTSKCCGE
jgi:hypothetical protein